MRGQAPRCPVAWTLSLTACVVLGACRERTGGGETGPGGGPASAPDPALTSAPATRILYPSAPGSFVDLVMNARHGVVAIRAGAPVKSGPAAMFPGTPETLADVSLGTGFLIESHGVFVLTNDHIATATTDLHVVLPDHREVPAKLVGHDVRLDLALLSIDPTGGDPRPTGTAVGVPTPR
ncbi:MAG TPA: trypsin-like peptidase domain-containing protein, partial [Kofleriaceae bacterium]|nr:trypsin-like peptidase domain-containing protein [Kofleriaceae bacterium]